MFLSQFLLVPFCFLFFVHFIFGYLGNQISSTFSLYKHEVGSSWKECVLTGKKGTEKELEVNSYLIFLFY